MGRFVVIHLWFTYQTIPSQFLQLLLKKLFESLLFTWLSILFLLCCNVCNVNFKSKKIKKKEVFVMTPL